MIPEEFFIVCDTMGEAKDLWNKYANNPLKEKYMYFWGCVLVYSNKINEETYKFNFPLSSDKRISSKQLEALIL